MNAEERYLLEPALELPPERLFDRRWATTLLETARDELKKEYRTRDQAKLFEKLAPISPSPIKTPCGIVPRALQ
jgi:RNA polymerase sigma-70 factor (ECF subfamily)